jgi:hypothetical protein
MILGDVRYRSAVAASPASRVIGRNPGDARNSSMISLSQYSANGSGRRRLRRHPPTASSRAPVLVLKPAFAAAVSGGGQSMLGTKSASQQFG